MDSIQAVGEWKLFFIFSHMRMDVGENERMASRLDDVGQCPN